MRIEVETEDVFEMYDANGYDTYHHDSCPLLVIRKDDTKIVHNLEYVKRYVVDTDE